MYSYSYMNLFYTLLKLEVWRWLSCVAETCSFLDYYNMDGLSYCNAVFLHFNSARSVSHDRWHGVPMGSRRATGRWREYRIAAAAARSEHDRGLLASLFYRWVLTLSLLLCKVMCRTGAVEDVGAKHVI